MGSLSTWDNRRLAVIRDLVAVTALNVKLKADTKKTKKQCVQQKDIWLYSNVTLKFSNLST